MVVPVVITAIVLFPFLLYIIFPSSDLIPYSIDAIPIPESHQLDKEKDDAHAQHHDDSALRDSVDEAVTVEEAENRIREAKKKEQDEQRMEEINEIVNNPFMDKTGALIGGILMTVCLTTLLATNAAGLHPGVYTMTVPSAFLMLVRDIWHDWGKREETRKLAKRNRLKKMRKNAEKRRNNEMLRRLADKAQGGSASAMNARDAIIMSNRPSPRSGDALELSEEEDIADYEHDIAINPHPLGRNPSSNGFEMSGLDEDSDVEEENNTPYLQRSRDFPTFSQSPEGQDIEAQPGSYFNQPLTSSPPARRTQHKRTRTKDSLFTDDTGRSSPIISPTTPPDITYAPSTPHLLVVPPTPNVYPIEAPPASPSRRPKDLPQLSIGSTPPVTIVSDESDMVSSPVSDNSLSGDGDKMTTENTSADESHSHTKGGKHTPSKKHTNSPHTHQHKKLKHRSVVGAYRKLKRYLMETFPTVCAVVEHLPFALLPFAFSMFILVQGLVTKGWVEVFASGWNKWVVKTGTIGAIGGMGFVSVCLCNVSGTTCRHMT